MSDNAIVQVVPYYPPHLGGMENVAKALAEAQAKSRHVEVLTTNIGAGGSPRVEYHDGLTIRRLRARHIASVPVAPGLLFHMLRTSPRAMVHVHIAQALVPEIVCIARKLRGGAFVAHFHLDVAASGRFGRCFVWYKKWILGYTLRAAAKVITFSDEQATFVQQTYHVDTGALTVVPNGVGVEFAPAPLVRSNESRPLRVLYVGRLSQQKAVPRLVNALHEMKQPVEAVIVGDGDQRPLIESLVQEHSLTNVRIVGVRRGAELVEFYHWADVFVLPSEREGMPLVVLEAMACGIPVVATDVVGNRELVAGVGMLVDPDPTAIALALDQLAQDYSLRAELRSRGLAAVKDYTWDHLVGVFDNVYAEAVS